MRYKNKTKTKVECPIYLGEEYRCPLQQEVCRHAKNVNECPGYQNNFMPDEEKVKMETKNLAMLVNAAGLKHLNKEFN